MLFQADRRGDLIRKAIPGQTAVLLLGAVGLGLLLAGLPLRMGVILVAVTAVVILTLINPLVGLFFALLAAPFGAWENAAFGPSLFDSGQLLLLFTLAVWIGRGLAYRQINIPHTFLNLPNNCWFQRTVEMAGDRSHHAAHCRFVCWSNEKCSRKGAETQRNTDT